MERERILVGGVQGSGKTYAWLTIAKALPDNRFYVIDPDDGVTRVRSERIVKPDGSIHEPFKDVHNIEYYFTPKWYTTDYAGFKKNGPVAKELSKDKYYAGVSDAWRLIKPKLKEGDWVVIEHLGNLWSKVTAAFADEVFDKNIGDYFLEQRKKMKEGAKRLEALEGWTDWNVINKMHNDDFMVEVCFENPAHVFMTTSVSIVQPGAKEGPEIKAFYGESSIRFVGQKENPFRAQTILTLKSTGSGKHRAYIMNTFQKDRGREWIEDYEWSDMYLEYLCMVGGW